MSIENKVFAIGHKLIIAAEKNLFSMSEVSTSEDLKNLHFVELTITEEKVVKGNYHPDQEFFGYKAKGSDGWDYICQWNNFAEDSTSPYQNWQRHFIAGVHYTLKAADTINKSDAMDKIDKWLISDEEFHNHYLNWEITICHTLNTSTVVEYLNKLFPDTQVFICDKVTPAKPDDPRGNLYHSVSGIQYVSIGCYLCKHLPSYLPEDLPVK